MISHSRLLSVCLRLPLPLPLSSLPALTDGMQPIDALANTIRGPTRGVLKISNVQFLYRNIYTINQFSYWGGDLRLDALLSSRYTDPAQPLVETEQTRRLLRFNP